jgi:hypothetical protein
MLFSLLAVALGACHRVGALDDAGAPDADSDTDSDADTDGDSDTDTDSGTQGTIDEPCDDVPEPAVVLGGGPDTWPDIDLDRFIDLAKASESIYNWSIGVLSEYEQLPDQWIAQLLMFELDSQALAGYPDLAIASGEAEFSPEERPVKLVDRLPHDIGQSVNHAVLFVDEEDGRPVIGAVLTPVQDEPVISRIADDPFEPAGLAIHGICGFDESLVAYGAGVWVGDDLVDWQRVEEIDPFPALNEMGSNLGGAATAAVGVGNQGRVVAADSPYEWLEPVPGTGDDLFAVALVPDSNTMSFEEMAGGEGGIVLYPATGGSWAGALAASDVTAMTWMLGGVDQVWIGTADGTLLRIDSSAEGCVAAELGEPVLALEATVTGFCQYALALTETTLYAVETFCQD